MHAVSAETLDIRSFKTRALFTARQWVNALRQFERFQQDHPTGEGTAYIIVKFEDIRSPTTGETELQK